MPRSIESYYDGLARIAQEITRTKFAPDADIEFLDTVMDLIIERVQNPEMAPQGVSAAGSNPDFSAQQIASQTQGQGGPTSGQGPNPMAGVLSTPRSAGPQMPDMSGATEELSRVLAGS